MSFEETVDEVFGLIVKAGLSFKSGGDADSATGYFSLVKIPDNADVRADMRYTLASTGEEQAVRVFDGLEAGWYFVTLRTADGAFFYPCETKDFAFTEFNEIQSYYDSFEEMGWGW